MKIANVLRRFAFSEWGGTETAVWNSAQVEKQMGNLPEIISTTALCETKFEQREGIDIRRFDYFYPYLFLRNSAKKTLDKKGGNPFSFKLCQYLIKNNFDIIHSHTMGRIAKLSLKAAKIANVPFVISFHGGCYDVPESEFEEMLKPVKYSLGYGRIIEKGLELNFDLAEHADGIICVGKNEYNEVRKRFPKKCATVIPNGVNSQKFSKSINADFRKAYNIPSERKLLLCVSRIDYQKNQRFLVRLAKRLLEQGEDVHVAFVGFVTSTSYYDTLVNDIKNSGFADRFTIVKGLAPDSDMLISAYKSADIFVLPSVHEPFGIVALEAWSAGLPIMASSVGGLKDFIHNGKNGFLFASDNIDSAQRAYFETLKNGAKTAKAALVEVAETYSWESVAKQILNFYAEVSNDFSRR